MPSFAGTSASHCFQRFIATLCRYSRDFGAALAAAQVAEGPKEAWTAEVDSIVYYRSQKEFERLARALRMMSEWKVSKCLLSLSIFD